MISTSTLLSHLALHQVSGLLQVKLWVGHCCDSTVVASRGMMHMHVQLIRL